MSETAVATSRYSTHASLLGSEARLKNDPGNVFVAYTGPSLRVRWETSQRVLIEHHADVQVFKKEPRRNDRRDPVRHLPMTRPDNKPLERPGANRRGEFERACASRSAPGR